jgi:hypothetical protein
LTNTTGSPYMTLLTGKPTAQAAKANGYGNTGGQGYSWNSSTLINIANPVATNYTMLVQAIDTGGDASYTVRIHAIGPQPVAFDGAGSTWPSPTRRRESGSISTINVPTNALGVGFAPDQCDHLQQPVAANVCLPG